MPDLEDNLKQDTPPNERREACSEYLDIQTVGHLNLIWHSKLTILRLMWLLVTVAGLVATIIHMVTLIETYLQHPSSYSSVLESNDTFEFPAVTVCNLNILPRDKVPCSDSLQELLSMDYVVMNINERMTEPFIQYWEENKHALQGDGVSSFGRSEVLKKIDPVLGLQSSTNNAAINATQAASSAKLLVSALRHNGEHKLRAVNDAADRCGPYASCLGSESSAVSRRVDIYADAVLADGDASIDEKELAMAKIYFNCTGELRAKNYIQMREDDRSAWGDVSAGSAMPGMTSQTTGFVYTCSENGTAVPPAAFLAQYDNDEGSEPDYGSMNGPTHADYGTHNGGEDQATQGTDTGNYYNSENEGTTESSYNDNQYESGGDGSVYVGYDSESNTDKGDETTAMIEDTTAMYGQYDLNYPESSSDQGKETTAMIEDTTADYSEYNQNYPESSTDQGDETTSMTEDTTADYSEYDQNYPESSTDQGEETTSMIEETKTTATMQSTAASTTQTFTTTINQQESTITDTTPSSITTTPPLTTTTTTPSSTTMSSSTSTTTTEPTSTTMSSFTITTEPTSATMSSSTIMSSSTTTTRTEPTSTTTSSSTITTEPTSTITTEPTATTTSTSTLTTAEPTSTTTSSSTITTEPTSTITTEPTATTTSSSTITTAEPTSTTMSSSTTTTRTEPTSTTTSSSTITTEPTSTITTEPTATTTSTSTLTTAEPTSTTTSSSTITTEPTSTITTEPTATTTSSSTITTAEPTSTTMSSSTTITPSSTTTTLSSTTMSSSTTMLSSTAMSSTAMSSSTTTVSPSTADALTSSTTATDNAGAQARQKRDVADTDISSSTEYATPDTDIYTHIDLPDTDITDRDNYFSSEKQSCSENVKSMLGSFGAQGRLATAELDDFTDFREIMTPDSDQVMKYMVAPEEFIHECTMDRTRCVPQDFEVIRDRHYGQCFVFNGHKSPSLFDPNFTNLATRFTGSEYGLRLTLFVNSEQYTGALSQDVGVKIVVHKPDLTPVPGKEGFNVPPDFYSAVGVNRKDIFRQKAPYEGDCTEDYPEQYKIFVPADIKYDKGRCTVACENFHLKRVCNCVNDPLINKAAKADLCNFRYSEAHLKCYKHVLSRIGSKDSDGLKCECKKACHQVIFTTGLSLAKWPSDPYRRLKYLYKLDKDNPSRVAQRFYDNIWKPVDPRAATRNDYVRLHVFIASNNYDVTREEPAYPFKQLLADVGGVLGLYLGMTLVTLLELVHLAVMFCYGANKDRRGDRVSPVPLPEAAEKPEKVLYDNSLNGVDDAANVECIRIAG